MLDKIGCPAPKISESYGGTSLHNHSHGESFITLVCERFGDRGLYILDEPESALSPQRQLTLLSELHRLVKGGSQFIIATHSPIITAYPGAAIFELSDNGICETSYKDTDNYRTVRDFVTSPERMLKYLFDE